MPTTDSSAIDALNSLLTGSRDGAQNFRDAAESVQTPDIKGTLGTFATETAEHAVSFEAEIRRLGGDPDDGGKLGAKARRVLQNVKTAVSGRDDSATLSEVEKGLDQAEQNYALALRESLDAGSRALVARNWADIQRHHNQVAAWLRQDPGAAQAARA